MEMSRPRSGAVAVAVVLWAVLYLASAQLSHQLNGPVDLPGYIWLPAGVTVGAFMLRPPREWLTLALTFLAAQLVLAAIEHDSYLDSLVFALIAIGAAALAVWLVRRVRLSLEGLYFLRSMISAALLTSLFGALASGAWCAFVKGSAFRDVALVWAASDFVGILLVAPVLASWSRFRAHRSGDHERFDVGLGIVSFALLVAGAWAIFDSGGAGGAPVGAIGFAVTYIPLFLTVAVTVLLGGRAGSLSVLVLAVIVILQTAAGDGPFSLLEASRGRSLLEAQLYLAVASLLVLTVSTLKTGNERVNARADTLASNIELALASADQVAYVLDPVTQTLEWSGDLQRAFGPGAEAAQLASVARVLDRLAPRDRDALRRHWRAGAADESGESGEAISFGIVQPDGAILRVTDRGAPLSYANLDVTVVAGVWQIVREPAGAAGA
ncbi:putative membrane protein [Burkholderia plantarii]|uniref:Putative membrane protein n=2 Tax=Burkholderia plantarii TaxID=41899 RepID=A0A0B6RW10_BURPL|nr:MASE1 domain-containing protein [Burkholderia plantarii]AJK49537.1 putative membrane protein [Burkholderia plantarii]